MKKLYKTMLAFIVVLSMMTIKLNAQMTGAYTVNGTIGASATNFISFTALASALNTSVVTGPVTINVVTGTGPYNEQVTINAITGVSGTNTITINGNGNTLTFNGTAAATAWTLRLGGADYMYWNNLTVTGTNATNAQPLHLYNGSDNNSFFNCVFSCPANVAVNNQYPISITGSPTSGTGVGLSGTNNVFTNCTTNGGRYAVSLYGNSSTPYNTDNKFINCNILDFYQMGFMISYTPGTTIRGCTIERPNRTAINYGYGIYINYNPGPTILVEGNKIRKMFFQQMTTSNFMYGIYNYNYAAQPGSETIIRNNVIANNTNDGDAYGIYSDYADYVQIYHNTIDINNQSAVNGGYVYGIICYGSVGTFIKNNVITLNYGGFGWHYNLMFAYNSVVCDRNILYNASLNNAVIGYFNQDYLTLATWQGANGGTWDQSSMTGNPNYLNPTLFDFSPSVPAMNNLGFPLGLATDVTGLARNLPAPDAGAFEFFNTPCSSTPGANTILTPTYQICPNSTALISLLNTYTVNGITFQWSSSTSSNLGPFTAISGATLASYQPTMTVNTWYSVNLNCVNGGTTLTPAAGQVSVAATTTNSVPYFEGFEGIQASEKLPNCSWAISDVDRCHTSASPTFNWITPHTGNKFAYHGTNNNGYGTPQYHYTNGIKLNAGITYSIGVWYVTPGYPVMSDFALELGTAQSPSGLVTLASVNYPQNNSYALLTNTFTVLSSGIYYVAIRSTDDYYYDYFGWDDLSITIPCQLPVNGVNLTVTAPSFVCQGQAVNLVASGAATYTWTGGPNTAAYSPIIQQHTTYTAMGTHSISGCTGTVSTLVFANPLPAVSIISNASAVCEGSSIILTAVGANTYTWNNGSNSAVNTVTPPLGATYTVTGTNTSTGCKATAVLPITVNSLPVVTITGGNNAVCQGDQVSLVGNGATTYTWISTNSFNVGTVINVTPMSSNTYTVYGTEATTGCAGTNSRFVLVEICTGLNAQSMAGNDLSVFPNPNNGSFSVILANGFDKTLDVTDVTGRVILTATATTDKIDLNISQLANGVYYVKVKSNNTVNVLKVVKQ